VAHSVEDSCVTWLYGPLYTAIDPVPPAKAATMEDRLNLDLQTKARPAMPSSPNSFSVAVLRNNSFFALHHTVAGRRSFTGSTGSSARTGEVEHRRQEASDQEQKTIGRRYTTSDRTARRCAELKHILLDRSSAAVLCVYAFHLCCPADDARTATSSSILLAGIACAAYTRHTKARP
jgi:hypothetical protein